MFNRPVIYRALATEIDEIRNGLWDGRLSGNSTNQRASSEHRYPNVDKTTSSSNLDQNAGTLDELHDTVEASGPEAQTVEQREIEVLRKGVMILFISNHFSNTGGQPC